MKQIKELTDLELSVALAETIQQLETLQGQRMGILTEVQTRVEKTKKEASDNVANEALDLAEKINNTPIISKSIKK